VSEASRRLFLLRYRVKPEHAEHNLQLVRAVFDELDVARPAGVRYSTFLLDDRVTFVNVVAIENEAGLNPLAELAAYRRIQEGKHERFDEAPITTELHEIGAYRIFSD
jgi:hypothetical protein